MRTKSLRSYRELVDMLDQLDCKSTTPPLVMLKVHPSDLINVEKFARYPESLTLVSEDECQCEGFIRVITSNGQALSESQLTISDL